MRFLSKMKLIFSVDNSILFKEMREKLHWMRKELFQNIAVSDFLFESIFLRILQNRHSYINHLPSLFNEQKIINMGSPLP